MAERIPDVIPVFPLPDLVFFPNTVLPLRVFEPRYLQLVSDAPRFGGWLAVAQLRSGSDRPRGAAPSFHPVATAGRLAAVESGPEGILHVRIDGLAPVRMSEVASDRLYRQVRVEVVSEDPRWLERPEAVPALAVMLREAVALRLLNADESAEGVPAPVLRRSMFVNRIASRVLAEPEERQALLECTDYGARVDLLLRQLRLMRNTLEALARSSRPDEPGWN